MQTSAREALCRRLEELRWKLVNERSAPALLQLLRDSADAMWEALGLLENPHPSEIDHLTAVTLLLKAAKPTTTVGAARRNYVDDSKAFDDAIDILRRLYRHIDDREN